MASEEKEFPPSEHKLRKLRAQGIFPWSREWMLLFSFIGAMAGLWLFCHQFLLSIRPELLEVIDNIERDTGSVTVNALGVFIASAWTILLPLAVVVLLGGALQTGFLFVGGKRESSRQRRLRNSHYPREHIVLRMVIPSIAWVCIVYLILKYLQVSIAPINESPLSPVSSLHFWESVVVPNSEMFSWPFVAETLRAQVAPFLVLTLAFLVLTAMVSRFLAVLSFRRVHSMSRSELEAESRELEMSPEMRRKLSRAYEE